MGSFPRPLTAPHIEGPRSDPGPFSFPLPGHAALPPDPAPDLSPDLRSFLSALRRSSLTALRLSSTGLGLEFSCDQSLRIDLAHGLTLEAAGAALTWHVGTPIGPALARLADLLETGVTQARLTPQALSLTFEGGARLDVLIFPEARESLVLTQTDPEEGLLLLRPL